MKITQVKTILTSPNQNYLFVKIITDEGIYGVGDASLNGRDKAVQDLIDFYFAPLLIGRDPSQIEDFWQLIYRGSYWRGGNIVMSALCGIDMALWDIIGKYAGLPLYKLLGGKVRDKVLCYSHILGKTNQEKIAEADEYVKQRGLKVLRLRAGVPAGGGTFGVNSDQSGPIVEHWTPEEEIYNTVDYFRSVREAVGPDVGIIYAAIWETSELLSVVIIHGNLQKRFKRRRPFKQTKKWLHQIHCLWQPVSDCVRYVILFL